MMLTHLAAALDTAIDVDPSVFDALTTLHARNRKAGLAALALSVSTSPSAFVLAIDDCHILQDAAESSRVLQTIAEHLPAGSQLALAGRAAPMINMALWQAEGKVSSFDVSDLRLDREQAGELLSSAGHKPTNEELSDLVDRTEGWAAGLYLAALALKTDRIRRPRLPR